MNYYKTSILAALICLPLLLNGAIIRYGGIDIAEKKNSLQADYKISFSGHYQNVKTGATSSGLGTFLNATSGSNNSITDTVFGTDIKMTVTRVIGGKKLLTNNNGTAMGVSTPNSTKPTFDANQWVELTFNKDVVIRQVGAIKIDTSGTDIIFKVGDQDFGPKANTPAQKNMQTLNATKRGTILRAGDTLTIGTGESGAWQLRTLHIEAIQDIPEPANVSLIVGLSASLTLFRRRTNNRA
jgi:hypothetical protein